MSVIYITVKTIYSVKTVKIESLSIIMLLIYKHISAIILIDQDFNNPVPKKKHDPYAPSAIVKPAFTYSTP